MLKIGENIYLNTSYMLNYKIYRIQFQDPTRLIQDPFVEFVSWCPHFELNT